MYVTDGEERSEWRGLHCLTWSAIYKDGRRIETFFEAVKQDIGIKRRDGTFMDAVMIQILNSISKSMRTVSFSWQLWKKNDSLARHGKLFNKIQGCLNFLLIIRLNRYLRKTVSFGMKFVIHYQRVHCRIRWTSSLEVQFGVLRR